MGNDEPVDLFEQFFGKGAIERQEHRETPQPADPEIDERTQRQAELFRPFIESLYHGTETQTRRMIEPLEARIAELEAQVAKLTEGSEP